MQSDYLIIEGKIGGLDILKIPCVRYTAESESESRSVVSYSLQRRGLYSSWNSPNTPNMESLVFGDITATTLQIPVIPVSKFTALTSPPSFRLISSSPQDYYISTCPKLNSPSYPSKPLLFPSSVECACNSLSHKIQKFECRPRILHLSCPTLNI